MPGGVSFYVFLSTVSTGMHAIWNSRCFLLEKQTVSNLLYAAYQYTSDWQMNCSQSLATHRRTSLDKPAGFPRTNEVLPKHFREGTMGFPAHTTTTNLVLWPVFFVPKCTARAKGAHWYRSFSLFFFDLKSPTSSLSYLISPSSIYSTNNTNLGNNTTATTIKTNPSFNPLLVLHKKDDVKFYKES